MRGPNTPGAGVRAARFGEGLEAADAAEWGPGMRGESGAQRRPRSAKNPRKPRTEPEESTSPGIPSKVVLRGGNLIPSHAKPFQFISVLQANDFLGGD